MLNNMLSSNLMRAGVLLLLTTCQTNALAELATLFTTPQERKIINTNRYKVEKVEKAEQTHQIIIPENKVIREPVREEVVKTYSISGISVSNEGVATVWINNHIYEDGESIDDASRVKVLVGDSVRVRITAPDGKNYYGSSGDTLEISYLVTVGG
ncbi:MAG: hypothetical protein GY784_07805 [Gammaproteobacteria bacterium]|nr:hypothetical protein [Gammaproteobacteria bacterium]